MGQVELTYVGVVDFRVGGPNSWMMVLAVEDKSIRRSRHFRTAAPDPQ